MHIEDSLFTRFMEIFFGEKEDRIAQLTTGLNALLRPQWPSDFFKAMIALGFVFEMFYKYYLVANSRETVNTNSGEIVKERDAMVDAISKVKDEDRDLTKAFIETCMQMFDDMRAKGKISGLVSMLEQKEHRDIRKNVCIDAYTIESCSGRSLVSKINEKGRNKEILDGIKDLMDGVVEKYIELAKDVIKSNKPSEIDSQEISENTIEHGMDAAKEGGDDLWMQMEIHGDTPDTSDTSNS